MIIAAYCRVSTEKEEQLDSLEHQKEFFSSYATKNGHKLVKVYADEGISGTSLKKRDEFKRLMEDAKFGLFEMVVVKDISRFARNTVDFLQSIRTLKSYGINTLFLTANMESLGESEFILTVFSAMAQEESANLSKRVKFGKEINSRKGRVPPRIFGYNRIDNFTLEINHEEAEVVRRIYDMYLNKGMGCKLIRDALNAEAVKTKYDCGWTNCSVRRILRNSIYCGRYINHKYEIKDYLTGERGKIPESEHYHHSRPEWAIVGEEDFEAVQQRLNQNKDKFGELHSGGRNSTKHTLSTLIKCEHCNYSFSRRTYTYVNTRNYWVCPSANGQNKNPCENRVKIEEDEIIDEIRKYLSEIISDKEAFIAEIISATKDTTPRKSLSASKEELEAAHKKLSIRKERYNEMYINDIITLSELKKKTSDINDEIKKIEHELYKLCDSKSMESERETFAKKYAEDIERFLSLEDITNSELKKVIDKISVSKDGKVTIFLNKFEQ